MIDPPCDHDAYTPCPPECKDDKDQWRRDAARELAAMQRSDALATDQMLTRLRKMAGNVYPFLHDVADRLEQLQMPHTEVLKLAELDEGADTQAMLKALCKKVEAQRREIAKLNEARHDER